MSHRDCLENKNQHTFEIEHISNDEVNNLIQSLPNKRNDSFSVSILMHKLYSDKITNYRPISILSELSRLLEKLLCIRIGNFVDRFHVINDNQFGFRKFQNTIDVINEFMCSAYECIN